MAINPYDKIAAAKVLLAREYPYFATAVASVHQIKTDAVPSMAVDEFWRLYWSPEFVDSITVEEAAGVVLHEIIHLLRGHPDRCRALHGDNEKLAKLTNIAADMAVNQDVRSDGLMKLPFDPVYPESRGLPGGLTLEEYFGTLRGQYEDAEAEEQKNENGKAAGDGDGDGKGSGGGEKNNADEKQEDSGESGDDESDGDDGEDDGASSGSASQGDDENGEQGGKGGSSGQENAKADPVGNGGGGSAGDGFRKPWELPPPDGTDETPGIGKEEASILRAATQEAMRQAGNAPGSWRRWAEPPEKVVNIRSKVRSALARGVQSYRAGCSEFTFARPRRRSEAYAPLILPGSYTRRLAVDIIIDTSGSIGDSELSLALAGVHDVSREFDCEVFAADTRIVSATKVFEGGSVTAVRQNLGGGGGTDMASAIMALDNDRSPYAEAMRPAVKRGRRRPDVIICITDGYTGWPQHRTRAKLFVVLVMNNRWSSAPGWATTINAF